MERTLQEDQTFALVYSKQEEGCQDKGLTSVTQANPSFIQQEHRDGITLSSDSIAVIVRAH